MISREQWKYRGIAGHFIGSRNCVFHIHTKIGVYRVSTVGAWYPRDEDKSMREIGWNRHYETMVFAEDEKGNVPQWNELYQQGIKHEGDDPEASDRKAEAMHDEVCMIIAEWDQKL